MGAKATINSYDEILSLDNFIENKEITLENFENILVDYEIKDTELKCCLIDENGNRCGREHYKGYLVLLKDGTYSLMGGIVGEISLMQIVKFLRILFLLKMNEKDKKN